MTFHSENFKAGDIIRYSDGISALVKLISPHAGGWHGSHVMGGTIYVSDFKKATEQDLDFCRQKKPEWFAKEIKSINKTDLIYLEFHVLRMANVERDKEWNPNNVLSLSFRGNELGGETGEAQNIIKKLERELLGLRGSRATKEQLAEELADIVICVDLIAMHVGIDLGGAVINKFNETSDKQNLKVKI